MGRWRRHLDPSVKKAGWQRSEDELLRALVAEHGAAWSQISRFLPGRTPQQVRARWCQLEGADSTPASTRARARRPGPGQAPGSSAGELVRHLPCYELRLGASTADVPGILDDLLAGLSR